MAPASFIHMGTTEELLHLLIKDMPSFLFLDWTGNVLTNTYDTHYACSNTYVSASAVIGEGSYLEDSDILSDSVIGKVRIRTRSGQGILQNPGRES